MSGQQTEQCLATHSGLPSTAQFWHNKHNRCIHPHHICILDYRHVVKYIYLQMLAFCNLTWNILLHSKNYYLIKYFWEVCIQYAHITTIKGSLLNTNDIWKTQSECDVFWFQAHELVDKGGDWRSRNKLKAYEAIYCLAVRDYSKAADLFIDCVSTFESYELVDFG